MKRVLLAFFLGFTLLVVCSTISADSQEVISAYDLYQAYNANPEATRQQYLNKTIQIKGVVISKGMSRYMTPNVELSDREGGQVLAICVLPRLDVNKLSNYKAGQIATFSGRVHVLNENRIIIKESKEPLIK